MSCHESPGWISLLLFAIKIYNFHKPKFFCKIYWSMNSERHMAGDYYQY